MGIYQYLLFKSRVVQATVIDAKTVLPVFLVGDDQGGAEGGGGVFYYSVSEHFLNLLIYIVSLLV